MTETGGGDGGGSGGDFLASLPEGMRGEGALKGFAGPEGGSKLAASYMELNRTFNSRSMADMNIPGDEAGIRAVLTKLGHSAPESADGYKLADRPNTAAFRAMAHKHGLTAKQAEAMFSDIDAGNTSASTERQTRMDSRKTETETALKGEWGDQYDANTALVQKATDHFFGEELRKTLEATGLDHNPEIRKLLHGVGRQLQEGTMHSANAPGMGAPTTAEAARTELNKHMSENSALILSQNDMGPGVKEAKEQHAKLKNNLARMNVQARTDAAGVATGAGA